MPHGELSLLMIDVDHFKLFNDTYGHPEGDACLCRIGETLAGLAAATAGFAARYGGEEFCLLLPNTDTSHALEIGEMVRAAVQGLVMPHATSGHQAVTVSVGVAGVRPSEALQPERSARSCGREPLRRQTQRPQHRCRAQPWANGRQWQPAGAGELAGLLTIERLVDPTGGRPAARPVDPKAAFVA